MFRNSLPVWGYRRDVQGKRPPRATCATPRLLAALRAIHFGTVRFNDKPGARHKCGPGWERFTTRLDVAKLNMMLSSGSLESGTGSSNSLRSASPYPWGSSAQKIEIARVLHLIRLMATDSLRYWITEMHVDGFRFDLGTILGRDGAGFDQGGGFLDSCRQDPLLSQVKLIAEPWDWPS